MGMRSLDPETERIRRIWAKLPPKYDKSINRSEGFMVVAVNYGQEAPDTVRKFWRQLDLQPAPFLDPDGRVGDA